MRWDWIFVAAALALHAPAHAQTSVTLNADPIPIIDAEINGRPVRLEVDLRLPDALVLNPAAAERLGVRRVPFAGVAVEIDGSARIRGRLARPRIVFGEEDSRAFTGIFPTPMSARADGLIGPGALPYDVVTIVLGPEPAGAQDIALALPDADVWRASAEAGSEAVTLSFDVSRQPTLLNRSATRAFDAAGLITASGELREAELVLGLSTQMQPVENNLSVAGFALGSTLARTNAPLHGAEEPDAIIVYADADAPPPEITLGRGALAQCASISVDRRTRRLTLRCAN